MFIRHHACKIAQQKNKRCARFPKASLHSQNIYKVKRTLLQQADYVKIHWLVKSYESPFNYSSMEKVTVTLRSTIMVLIVLLNVTSSFSMSGFLTEESSYLLTKIKIK